MMHSKPSDAKQQASTRSEAKHSMEAEGIDGGQITGRDQNDQDDQDDDDNDDLLVVKRRDVLDSSESAAEGADSGIPLGGVELRGNKKRKRVRIDPGKMSGARTVFDEEGESLQPLALLAKEQLDRSGQSFVSTTIMCFHLVMWIAVSATIPAVHMPTRCLFVLPIMLTILNLAFTTP